MYVQDFPEKSLHISLHQRVYVFLGEKAHLHVNLCKLGLTVGSQVFVAETFNYLEILVKTADHKNLLENLRRLGQGIESPGIDPARHQVVPGSLGS